MKILYISNLTGQKSAGLTYSIPAQIINQKKYDEVFWYNINSVSKKRIINSKEVNNLNDYPTMKICDLPIPFNDPDLVVFQGVYMWKYIFISRECRKRNIPYIIVPRSSLTYYAQKKKYLKKVIANFFFFNSFIKNAKAIHYLTNEELKTSGEKWNESYIIIPNGIESKSRKKIYKNKDNIIGVYIGRPDIYQKGIDLFLDACKILKNKLIEYNCQIEIYAPKLKNDKDNIDKMIEERGLNNIIIKRDGIYGKEKERVLLNSDFFVLTSRFEGHPMGLIEALSYGLPCIVTTGTNMAEDILSYNAGWTADIDVKSITKAINDMLDEKDELCVKGKNALELSYKFEWDIIAKTTSDVFKKILKND